jgi:hypothetical protein
MEKVMSRPASEDAEALLNARQAIVSTQTVEPLRQVQAVGLPLDYGPSLVQTAQVIGASPCWACQLHRRFMGGQIRGAPTMLEEAKSNPTADASEISAGYQPPR